jgi:[ribosomal protein S5]-alanine N-acetyltransferase
LIPVVIETERLILRPPCAEDARRVFERYASDPRVTQYLGWPTHRTINDTVAFLGFCDAEWKRWPAGPFLIESRASGALMGSTGLNFESPQQAATGYVLSQDCWGFGYATEALAAMRELAARLGVTRLYALCHPDHRASSRVLEKCGFALEGTLAAYAEFPNLKPGVRDTVLCYAVRLPIC